MEQCPYCDEALPVVRDAYCPACRSALDDEPADKDDTPPTGRASSPEGSKGELWLERALSVICLCAFAGVGCFCLNESRKPPSLVLGWVGLALCAPFVALIVLQFVATLLAFGAVLFSGRKAG